MEISEMKWFYEPKPVRIDQDLEKEVTMILNKEPIDTQFEFI